MTITETEPGIQGDRVSGARKPATLETGLVVQVPLFVNIDDVAEIKLNAAAAHVTAWESARAYGTGTRET